MSDSRSASWRGRNRVVVLTFVLLAAAVLATPASAHRPHSASPGAAGLGDRLFPLLGNGGYDAKHYDLALSYASTAPVQSVDGFMTMRAVATQGLSRFNLDFNGDAVHRVSVNGRRADWRLDGEELVITPRKALRKHDKFKTTVTFTSGPDAPAPDDPFPAGWFTTVDGSVTAAQPDRGNEIYPVNDHPSDKATYRYALLVPDGMTAVANGRLTGQRDFGARTLWTYEMDEPMASQLIQLAVGDLDVIRRGRVTGVHLRDVVASNAVATSEPTLATTPDHMRWMVDKIGRYPFDTYGVLAADQVFFYALETQTLSLHPTFLFDPAQFPDQEFAQTIMVHELAHQWFGDDVAIATWSDLWLSEGHATWYEQEYAAEVFGADFVGVHARGAPRVRPAAGGVRAAGAAGERRDAVREQRLRRRGAGALRAAPGDRRPRVPQAAAGMGRSLRRQVGDHGRVRRARLQGRPPRPAGVHGAMALQHHDAADAGHPDWTSDPVPAAAAAAGSARPAFRP